MNTQEIREFKLTLVTEGDKVFNFIEKMHPKKFVRIHQDNFKDDYLSQPPIEEIGAEFIDEYCLWDTITEKYRDFFDSMGVDGTFKWLNNVDHLNENAQRIDYDFKSIRYEMGLIDDDSDEYDDDERNDIVDLFSYLYGYCASGWGYDWFIYEMVNLYYDYMNDEHLEMESLVD
jgi:hypothetical protein